MSAPAAARAMPAMIYLTHGTGTLLPKALYRAESEAPGRSAHPSGNPEAASHSSGEETPDQKTASVSRLGWQIRSVASFP